MKYTIYKITNNINGKYYIGQHKTENINDNYMGSGKLIKLAIKKYGKENFSKEILKIFNTFDEMNKYEKLIVTEEFRKNKKTYNIELGGNNAPLIEETKIKISKKLKGRKLSDTHIKHISEKQGIYKRTEIHKTQISNRLKGKIFSEQHKEKISINSSSSKKFIIIKDNEILFEGYNLSKFCKENGFPDSSFRKSSKSGLPIQGKTKKTKPFKGWEIKIDGDNNEI